MRFFCVSHRVRERARCYFFCSVFMHDRVSRANPWHSHVEAGSRNKKEKFGIECNKDVVFRTCFGFATRFASYVFHSHPILQEKPLCRFVVLVCYVTLYLPMLPSALDHSRMQSCPIFIQSSFIHNAPQHHFVRTCRRAALSHPMFLYNISLELHPSQGRTTRAPWRRSIVISKHKILCLLCHFRKYRLHLRRPQMRNAS